ncbi:hypothetical protein A2363_01660 [Candidatus Gottesmanbacteria bacterium RIFOXYB1_FULL_47_11]|uniref:Crotonobetainyl-CoA--carnitine CoA-transferase n=1 Tax=Candidatus Gottesmanbacteria bacterium RIFOXYB1_FULL_47_11 TaxID=1798401 RepID=A0A1F6BG70_9BACT|nr:MAG: hypothetical protein A2363_01660 [Candidatus Gottesmanbacteria bacterium RIFOXYB1_FULL_47_11]
MQILGNKDQIQNRERLIKLFHGTPLPDEHLMVNLGLYQRSSVVAKYFYLNELYEKILPIPGVIMEFGCWYGQTMVQLMALRAMLEPYNSLRKIIGFDTFTGYRGITKKDGTDTLIKNGQYGVPHEYYSYLTQLLDYHERENPMSHVKKYELVKGDAALTVKKYLKNNPQTVISLAYFDMQLYKPTKACLTAILPYCMKGSVIAMDELNAKEFPGETTALKEVVPLTKYPIYRSKFLPNRSYIVIT